MADTTAATTQLQSFARRLTRLDGLLTSAPISLRLTAALGKRTKQAPAAAVGLIPVMVMVIIQCTPARALMMGIQTDSAPLPTTLGSAILTAPHGGVQEANRHQLGANSCRFPARTMIMPLAQSQSARIRASALTLRLTIGRPGLPPDHASSRTCPMSSAPTCSAAMRITPK